MATYKTLRSGSSGDEVRQLQQSLVDAGYDVGSAGVDGIFGSATDRAVRKYQQDKGLVVDGIVGEETWGSIGSNKPVYETPVEKGPAASIMGTGSTPTSDGSGDAAPDYSQYQYDPGTNEAYQQAIAALQQAQQNMPSYAATYDQQLQDLYEQIVNRKDFSYDLNGDALYQQYKDQYTQQGKLAMMDTMGQAAALTGGYGSSYGQAVGQQQYQAYLQQLNEVVPELYGMALDQYNQEGQDMLNQYGMLGDMADTEYSRYQDALNQYWQNLSYQKQLADDAYDQGYNNWWNAQQMGYQTERDAIADQQWQQQMDRQAEQDALEEAWRQKEWDFAQQQYKDSQKVTTTGGAGGNGNTGSSGLTYEQMVKLDENVATWAARGEDYLNNQLSYWVANYGLDPEYAAELLLHYFPNIKDNIPPAGKNPSKPGGGGSKYQVHLKD